jgi:predicted dehydrogenase
VNLSRYVAGEPELVFGTQILAEGGADVRFTGSLRFPGSALGHFDCGFDLPLRHEAEIVGSEGVLGLSPAFARDDGVLELRRGDEVERVDVPPTHRYALQVENFARAVLGEEPPLLDRRESVAQAAALDALLRSAESERPVRLVEGA